MIDLRLGDCLDLLPTLEAQSIGAVIADIPYGTTACKWDTVIPFEPMWRELKRVAKPRAAIVLFGAQPFTSALVMSNPKWFKHDWVWNKAKPGNFLNSKIEPLQIHESVIVFGGNGKVNYIPQMTKGRARNKKPARKFYPNSAYGNVTIGKIDIRDDYYPKSILDISNANHTNRVHPTQKPVALMEYLICTYTNEGDTVLDFTMGSGTTMVACVNTKRNGIGFEIMPEYFEIAKKRIAEAQQQLILL